MERRVQFVIGFALVIVAFGLPLAITAFFTEIPKPAEVKAQSTAEEKSIVIVTQGEDGSLDVSAYLTGVLASELSPDTCMEAIKAQAIVERTNLYRELEEQLSGSQHKVNADQLSFTYMTNSKRQEDWGSANYAQYEKCFEKAVEDTKKKVLIYENTYIEALFHKVSIGKTVSAKELYDKDVPYLQAVDSLDDVESSAYMNIYYFKPEELAKNLKVEKITDFAVQKSTENGYVKEVLVNEDTVDGQKVKDLLKLSSLNFYIEKVEDQYRMVALGSGHGLGLSLYGANAMAQKGENYEKILTYYYEGAVIEKR